MSRSNYFGWLQVCPNMGLRLRKLAIEVKIGLFWMMGLQGRSLWQQALKFLKTKTSILGKTMKWLGRRMELAWIDWAVRVIEMTKTRTCNQIYFLKMTRLVQAFLGTFWKTRTAPSLICMRRKWVKRRPARKMYLWTMSVLANSSLPLTLPNLTPTKETTRSIYRKVTGLKAANNNKMICHLICSWILWSLQLEWRESNDNKMFLMLRKNSKNCWEKPEKANFWRSKSKQGGNFWKISALLPRIA